MTRNSQPRLIKIPEDGVDFPQVGDYWYYGKNEGRNPGNYHYAIVCGHRGYMHVQESGKKATLEEAKRVAQNHIELRDDRRKLMAKLQKQINAGKLTVGEALEKITGIYGF